MRFANDGAVAPAKAGAQFALRTRCREKGPGPRRDNNTERLLAAVHLSTVVCAKAGTQRRRRHWIPAFAGMTDKSGSVTPAKAGAQFASISIHCLHQNFIQPASAFPILPVIDSTTD